MPACAEGILVCVRVQLIIANGTMEMKKRLMQASTADKQVRRGARCFSTKSGDGLELGSMT